MQITIWGGSGFIGQNLSKYFSNEGYKVIIADIKKTKNIYKNQTFVKANIFDQNDIKKTIKNSKYVFNFAGISDIEESDKNINNVINHNVLGNINLLEACRKNNIKKYIYASTIYIFSKNGGFYKCSKQAAELFINEYNKKYKLKYNILRFGTVYGLGADNNNSIFDYVYKAIKNEKIKINSDNSLIREYVHVDDISKICGQILDRKHDNQDYILTGNYQTKISDLMNLISEILGKKLKVKYDNKLKNLHYKITPYSYQETVSKKFTNVIHTDLGQGILEIISEIKNNEKKKK